VSAKRARVYRFVRLLYAAAALEIILALVFAIQGPALTAVPMLVAAVLTVALARAFWRGFERRGDDDWRYSWRGVYRKLRR